MFDTIHKNEKLWKKCESCKGTGTSNKKTNVKLFQMNVLVGSVCEECFGTGFNKKEKNK